MQITTASGQPAPAQLAPQARVTVEARVAITRNDGKRLVARLACVGNSGVWVQRLAGGPQFRVSFADVAALVLLDS